LTALDTQHSTAKNLLRIGIYHSFHKAARLIDFQRTCHVIHRHLSNLKVVTPLLCLCLAQSHASQLWINENRVRYQSMVYGSIAPFKQIGANNAEIVIRDVSKGRTTLYISQSIDTR